MAPVQSSRHIESAFKRESEQRKERLSFTSRNPRKRSQTPRGKGEQIYDFGKSPAKGRRIRRTFQGTSSLKNRGLYGNLKGMMMYGQTRPKGFKKFSVNHLQKH